MTDKCTGSYVCMADRGCDRPRIMENGRLIHLRVPRSGRRAYSAPSKQPIPKDEREWWVDRVKVKAKGAAARKRNRARLNPRKGK